MLIFYQNATGTFEVNGFTENGSPSNTATMTATLFNPAGVNVSGFIGVPGTYVPGSQGDYTFPIPALSVPAGGNYTLVVTATTLTNTRQWTIAVIVASS